MAKRIITPEAILSYPRLFEPQVNDDGVDQYSCALIFTKDTDISALEDAAFDAMVDEFGEKKAEKLWDDRGFRKPFRDDAKDGYPEGCVFINVRSTRKPQVVSIYPDKNGKPSLIEDPEEVYPGCIVRASITPFIYDRKGNRGVSFGLNNIQKLRDGERLDSFVKAQDEFEADAEAAAALDALTNGSEQEDEKPRGRRGRRSRGSDSEESLAEALK